MRVTRDEKFKGNYTISIPVGAIESRRNGKNKQLKISCEYMLNELILHDKSCRCVITGKSLCFDNLFIMLIFSISKNEVS